MDFADLRVFKAVADEGGISAAARKLHRVQSNVTTRIKQLEASLGTALFRREKGRLRLSPPSWLTACPPPRSRRCRHSTKSS
jgi:DNA-binding transcriptional LysR family regulator